MLWWRFVVSCEIRYEDEIRISEVIKRNSREWKANRKEEKGITWEKEEWIQENRVREEGVTTMGEWLKNNNSITKLNPSGEGKEG